MGITTRLVRLGRTEVVEYSQPGCDTVYVLNPSVAAEVDRTRDQVARWRLAKQSALVKRQKRPGE